MKSRLVPNENRKRRKALTPLERKKVLDDYIAGKPIKHIAEEVGYARTSGVVTLVHRMKVAWRRNKIRNSDRDWLFV